MSVFNNLSDEDRKWLEIHQIENEKELMEVVERLSCIFSDISQGIMSSFMPVIKAFDDFLINVPGHIAGNRLDQKEHPNG